MAGPANLGDFVSDLDIIPTQNPRDLLNREAAQEQFAQLAQLRIRPFFASFRRRFVLNLGPSRIDDRGPNDPE
jgi:hypothetical protein